MFTSERERENRDTEHMISILPVFVSNQWPKQLYVDIRLGTLPADFGLTFLQHVQQHLGELGIFVQIDEIWFVVVQFEGDT